MLKLHDISAEYFKTFATIDPAQVRMEMRCALGTVYNIRRTKKVSDKYREGLLAFFKTDLFRQTHQSRLELLGQTTSSDVLAVTEQLFDRGRLLHYEQFLPNEAYDVLDAWLQHAGLDALGHGLLLERLGAVMGVFRQCAWIGPENFLRCGRAGLQRLLRIHRRDVDDNMYVRGCVLAMELLAVAVQRGHAAESIEQLEDCYARLCHGSLLGHLTPRHAHSLPRLIHWGRSPANKDFRAVQQYTRSARHLTRVLQIDGSDPIDRLNTVGQLFVEKLREPLHDPSHREGLDAAQRYFEDHLRDTTDRIMAAIEAPVPSAHLETGQSPKLSRLVTPATARQLSLHAGILAGLTDDQALWQTAATLADWSQARANDSTLLMTPDPDTAAYVRRSFHAAGSKSRAFPKLWSVPEISPFAAKALRDLALKIIDRLDELRPAAARSG